MRRNIFVLVLCVVLGSWTGSAAAGWLDDWDKADRILLGVHGALWVADWGQTRDIARQPDKYYETNPILGKHPTVQEVDLYFISVGILGAFIADQVGERIGSVPRKLLLVVWIIDQAGSVSNNHKIGLKINFNL
jgi:hypothetical protein